VSPPSGTVAFLFSDIEASTRRWERYGDAMRDALRRHDQILRSTIEARRGHVFKTIGDAFCAVFWSVGEALEAAVDAQRRLGHEDFGATDGLYVRMAIHVGETDERGGDYFGSAVNRTARLLCAAHGGQILLSGVAADSVLPNLPGGVALRHLGAVPLRDIKEPERVYQPVANGLRSEFAPLHALERSPNNLPHQRTSFVGRQEDIARVEALLDEGPLVTIVGTGGIGKTRLALEVGTARLNDYRDGAWFVDLASIANASLIPSAILSALGAEQPPGADALETLLVHLEKRELLLVLDNSEHLVAQAAAIVDRIVERCPRVSVLATSREPLDIVDERLYRLSTLDLPSAIRLFGDRARAVSPGFRLDEKRGAVEEICSRLDGIALAIELAAARVRTMSVESLASHLELRLLAGGRDRRPRQQTMRALIDWSYDLLTEEERLVLRRAAVFVRGFTLGSATNVCGTGPAEEGDVLHVLLSLVDKSLVIADAQESGERYRLLEPIREYAWEKLAESGGQMEAQRRHAGALALLAHAAYEEWQSGHGEDWLARVEREVPNFRTALRWSVDEGNDRALGAQLVADATPVFLRLGLLSEGIERCERILQAGLALPAVVEGHVRYGLSMLHSNLGDDVKCLDEAAIAVRLFRQAGDRHGLARALSQVAFRYAAQARFEKAKPLAEEALQLARDSGDRRLLADVLRRSARSFADEGASRVRALFGESVSLFRAHGRDDETALALDWWAKWELENGNYRDAATRFLEALELRGGGAMTMFRANDIASCYLALGERSRAEAFARESLALAAKVKHPILTPLGVAYLGAVASERNAAKAARLLGYAHDRLRTAGWELDSTDAQTLGAAREILKAALKEAELARLLEEGAAWSDDFAVGHALSA
jgi:predicted ATPase/class 3 adenylate cyclase